MEVVIIPHSFQEHYTLGFVNGLARRGVKVSFVRASNTDDALIHPSVSWCDLGCNTEGRIGLFSKAYKFIAYHLRLIAYVAKRHGAIVHVIGLTRRPVLVTGILVGLLFRAMAGKYVLTVHDILPHDKHTTWNRWVHKLVYRIPDLLVVHTAKMKDQLSESFGVNTERILFMEHGLNDIVPDHGRSAAECRGEFGLPKNGCALLLFGRIAPYKGVETLLDAIRYTNTDVYVVIAGVPYGASYGQKIERLIKEHPGRERIIYRPGFVSNAEIATYFRAADAIVMPYRHIDQSGVLFLAFRFGLPIIATDVGSLREYVTEHAGILVREASAQEFAKGIDMFQRERQRFTHELMLEQSVHYQWENVLEPLVSAYES